MPFQLSISNKWETAMTSQGHVTAASLKQAHKEDNREVFFIGLYLKKLCVSTLKTSHNKLRDLKQDDDRV